jgi:hypothetical protein
MRPRHGTVAGWASGSRISEGSTIHDRLATQQLTCASDGCLCGNGSSVQRSIASMVSDSTFDQARRTSRGARRSVAGNGSSVLLFGWALRLDKDGFHVEVLWDSESVICKNPSREEEAIRQTLKRLPRQILVRITHGAQIFDSDSHLIDARDRARRLPEPDRGAAAHTRHPFRARRNREDCWIGTNSIVLKGVKIGNRSIVAADSVVSRLAIRLA